MATYRNIASEDLTVGVGLPGPLTVKPDETRKAEKKIYVAAAATDAMGIGAWTKPGRGKIPYTWQVLMNWAWMNPPALQYFYEDKSPNDYFIGGLDHSRLM